MTRIATATDLNLSPVPIVRPDFSRAARLAADPAAAVSHLVDESGVLLITTAVDIYMRVSGVGSPAADSAGSIYLPAGSQYHMIVRAGETVSVLAAGTAGGVFLVPLSSSSGPIYADAENAG